MVRDLDWQPQDEKSSSHLPLGPRGRLLDKMVVLSEGETLGMGDLPPSTRAAWRDHGGAMSAGGSASPADLDGRQHRPEDLLADGPIQFADVERRLLAEAIRRAGGNLSEAARQLGMSYKTLCYRAGKFGLDGEAPRE